MDHQDQTWVLGDLYTFLLSTPELAILEVETKGTQGPPLHSHDNEEESFYVLEGLLEVTRGETTLRALKGDFVHFPKGTQHTFRNVTPEGSRLLVILSPGKFAKLFREIGIAKAEEAHEPHLLQQAQQKLIALSGAYGLRIAGPRQLRPPAKEIQRHALRNE